MTGTDGEETRLYRRVSAPFFNKSTFQRVWRDSVGSTNELLAYFIDYDSLTIEDLRPALARLTLHIVNMVAFEKCETLTEEMRTAADPRHKRLGHFEAMSSVLDNFATIFLSPSWILRMQDITTTRLHSANDSR